MRVAKLASKVHKWLALVVGVQIILWFASGWFLSFFPIEQVRGEHLIRAETAAPLGPEAAAALPAILARSGPATRIEIRQLGQQPVVQIDTDAQRPRLFALPSGEQISPLTADHARIIAASSYNGPGKPGAVRAIAQNSPEYRGPLPAWRVAFNDSEDTAFYIAADTGKVTARRTNLWRTYDFLWGLHIMDWTEHADFNHWWLWMAAALGLIIALSGLTLVPSRFGWNRKRRRRQVAQAHKPATNSKPI